MSEVFMALCFLFCFILEMFMAHGPAGTSFSVTKYSGLVPEPPLRSNFSRAPRFLLGTRLEEEVMWVVKEKHKV